jgi:microsomal dipeptidase-like Zn-dependent dipeptidase
VARRLLIGLAATLALTAGVVFGPLPGWVEADRNRVLSRSPYRIPEAALARHRQLLVADLHADSLLWNRDLAARGARGQVDLPRLVEGNVGIQVFGLVTRSPAGQNIHRTSGEGVDNITLLALAQRWPSATWSSPLARATYQAGRLAALAEAHPDQLALVRSRSELQAVLTRRARGEPVIAGLLGVEGAHCLEGDPARLPELVDAGVRMLGLAHFFDNAFAGSAHGVAKHGLTEAGRDLIQRAEAAGVLIDLAHASPKAFDEALALATRPVVVSHTGVRGTCDNDRNLTKAQLEGVAATGGLVGIGYWKTATCGADAAAIAGAIRYAVMVVGPDHVALGSDFDGAVTTPFDAAGLAWITQALVEAGLDDETLAKVMGGNVKRLLLETLPD